MILFRLSPLLYLLSAGASVVRASSSQKVFQDELLRTLHQDPKPVPGPPTSQAPGKLQRVALQAWPVLPSNSPPEPVRFATVEYLKPARRQSSDGRLGRRVCRIGDQDEALSGSLPDDKSIKAVIVDYTPPTQLIGETSLSALKIGIVPVKSDGANPSGLESGTSIASAKLFSTDLKLRIVLFLDYDGNAWRAEVHPTSAYKFSNLFSDKTVQASASTTPLTEKQIARQELKKKKQAERQALREKKLEERKQKLLEARKAAGIDLEEAARKDAERAKKAEEKKRKKNKGLSLWGDDDQIEPVVAEVRLMECGSKPVLNPRVIVNEGGKVDGKTQGEEKSWFQKYWWAIALLMLLQIAGPLMQETGQDGAPEGQNGAPSK